MKRLLSALALCLALSSPVVAMTIPIEHISGVKPNGPYYSFDIGFFDNAIRVDVDVRLWGDAVVDSLLARWESGIESIWSTDRFAVPILFDVAWVLADWDHSVRVTDGTGRWNTANWYTVGSGGWGDSYLGAVAAHEFGHFLGAYDEYWGARLDPLTGRINTGGLMATLSGPTLAYYYDPFLLWYDDRLGDYGGGDPVATPEPSSLVLLAAGMFALAVRMKRREV